jgi:HSP20 family molecular chaperone IbpA
VRSVSDDKQDERDETRGGMTWHRVERASSFQQRALRFPDAADLTKVEANVDNGVLRVCIAKRQEAQGAKRQTIKVA